MSHGRQRGRNKSFDGTIVNTLPEEANEHKSLSELGEEFVSDKKKLEDAMTRVENANISDADKKKLKAELDAAMDKIIEKYETDVKEEQHRLEDEMNNYLKEMEEEKERKKNATDEMQAINDSVGPDGGDSGALDVSDALKKAQEQEAQFKEIYADQKQRLELQMQQAAERHREMTKKQLSK